MKIDRRQALFVSLLIVLGCGGGGTTTSTSIATTTTTAETTTLEPWAWGIDSVDLGEGYVLGPCEGDANQIACITIDGSVIGSAEHLALPVDSFDLLDGVEDPLESIELIAADYVATFMADRQSTCPNLEFKELTPMTVTVGRLPGFRYGFEELEGTRTVEKNVIYGARVEQSINLYSFAAIAEGACLSNEGELADPAIVDSLMTGLDRALALVESG